MAAILLAKMSLEEKARGDGNPWAISRYAVRSDPFLHSDELSDALRQTRILTVFQPWKLPIVS